jgi:Tfp pilus assembly protein PilF
MNKRKLSVFDDFSKEVLVRYLMSRFLFPREKEKLRRELCFIQWETMVEKAKTAMDCALAASASCDTKTMEGRARWFENQKQFDAAQKIYDQADQFYKRSGLGT